MAARIEVRGKTSMAEISLKQPALAAAGDTSRSRAVWKRAATMVGASALVALCAHIAVPLGFTPVPMTLQPFAVLLLGLLLSPGMAFGALVLYLVEGASGLPVFSPHGPGGIAQLLGPTGGYLLAEPFAAALAGSLYRAGRRGFGFALAGAAAGDLVLLGVGALWLGVLEHARGMVILHQAVLPFVASDAVKVLAAATLAMTFRSIHRRRSAAAE
jgi:biotin transport system substrate-specific component